MRLLKNIRVGLSLLFFAMTLLIFVDVPDFVSPYANKAFLWFQFIPSLLSFVQVATLASAGFIVVLLLTLLFGRLYCSTICPLGTLMDVAIWIRRRIRAIRENKQTSQPLYSQGGSFSMLSGRPEKAGRFSLVRYALLVLAVLTPLLNSLLLINLLDPFSLAGKMFATLFRPLYLMGFNITLMARSLFDTTVPKEVYVWNGTVFLLIFNLLLFSGIILLALLKDRWYCNVICPVGALLGLVSKISVFRLRVLDSSCTGCGTCLKVCKGRCIDPDTFRIEDTTCVKCFNCVSVCDPGAIGFRFAGVGKVLGSDRQTDDPGVRFNAGNEDYGSQEGNGGRGFRNIGRREPSGSCKETGDKGFRNIAGSGSLNPETRIDQAAHGFSRRHFFRTLITGVTGASGVFLTPSFKGDATFRMTLPASPRDFLKTAFTGSGAGSVPLNPENPGLQPGGQPVSSGPVPGASSPGPVTPPGSIGISHFTDFCTSCHRCISNCPARVLQPSLFEYGLTGVFQPKLDFHIGYCHHECNTCLQVCPTGAITSLELSEKKRVKIGCAVFIRNLCIVTAQRRRCGLCAAKCPVKAIRLIPYLGDLALPEVTDSLCTGCGACEFICPVRPDRAITVDPLMLHRRLGSS